MMIIPFNPSLFDRLCREALLRGRAAGEGGIGTLAEKRMHAIVKKYVCPCEDFHEVGIENTRYVADIMLGNYIFEIQTGAFEPMKKKIDHYLKHTDATVTVIHPIPAIKWVTWVDPDTAELSPRARSPKKGRAEDLLPKLYCLREHLQDPRLRFAVMLMEVQDFRLLNPKHGKNRKRGSERYERIPLRLLEVREFSSPEDFACFLPAELPRQFTAKDFSALTKLRGRDVYSAIRVLSAMGFLEEAEKQGRSLTWKIKDD